MMQAQIIPIIVMLLGIGFLLWRFKLITIPAGTWMAVEEFGVSIEQSFIYSYEHPIEFMIYVCWFILVVSVLYHVITAIYRSIHYVLSNLHNMVGWCLKSVLHMVLFPLKWAINTTETLIMKVVSRMKSTDSLVGTVENTKEVMPRA